MRPTQIKFSDTVKLEDKEIPAGEYALFTIPTANEWTIILSKDAKVQSAADYKQENDAARITAKPDVMPMTIETFTIGLDGCERRFSHAESSFGTRPACR